LINKKGAISKTRGGKPRVSFIITVNSYLLSFLRMELNSVKKVIVVTVAAMISLTGSARNTAKTLLSKKFGSMKIRGISKKQTDFRLAESHKALLAAYLEANREDSGHVDAECPGSVSYKFLI